MTWNDRVSFVLTEALQLKKVTFLDTVFEEASKAAGDGKDDNFDADVIISTGELSQLIPDLMEALGGETAQDFDQELLILFDAYVHGVVDRRGFLEKAQKFAVGGMTAVGLLAALSPDFASAQQIAKDDKRIVTSSVELPSPAGYGTVKGYLVRPAGTQGKLPTVLVVHENRGLNPHIEDIARRLALEGYLVFAPDALAPLGGYPGDEDKARTLFATLDQKKTAEDFVASAQ
eukprot:gene25801-25967_t